MSHFDAFLYEVVRNDEAISKHKFTSQRRKVLRRILLPRLYFIYWLKLAWHIYILVHTVQLIFQHLVCINYIFTYTASFRNYIESADLSFRPILFLFFLTKYTIYLHICMSSLSGGLKRLKDDNRAPFSFTQQTGETIWILEEKVYIKVCIRLLSQDWCLARKCKIFNLTKNH